MNSNCEDTFVLYMTLMTAVTFEIVVAFMTKNMYFLIMACNSAIVPNWYFSQNTHLFKKRDRKAKKYKLHSSTIDIWKDYITKSEISKFQYFTRSLEVNVALFFQTFNFKECIF